MKTIADKNSIKAAKDFRKKIAAKDADQYMLRLPPGLRDRVAQKAADNGRSMNTEIVEAIEQHLTRTDRVTQLWELFEKHKENIEAIPMILSAIENLHATEVSTADYGEVISISTTSEFYNWMNKKRHRAYLATLPVVTANEAQTIKALLKETAIDEQKFLALASANRVGEIRGFDRAKKIIESNKLITAEQVQIIKAVLKERGGDWEKKYLSDMRVPRLEDIRGFERAMTMLPERLPNGAWVYGGDSSHELLTGEQVQIIKSLVKEIGTDEERFLAAMGVPRIEDIRGFMRAMKLLGGLP
jgi:hypothetical protein